MGIFDWLFWGNKKSESDKIEQKDKYQRYEDERSKELEQQKKIKINQSSEEGIHNDCQKNVFNDGRLKDYEDDAGELKWFNENGDLLSVEQILKNENRLGFKNSPMLNGRILHGAWERTAHLDTDPSDFKKINGYLFQWFYKRNELDNRGRLVVFNGDCHSYICKDEDLLGIYKDGIEIKNLKKEESVTENVEKKQSNIVEQHPDLKERTIYTHEIATKGVFIYSGDDSKTRVSCQEHKLVAKEQTWSEESEEWEDDGDRDNIDEFYLTGHEEGYQFDQIELCEFFGIDDWEWDYNGFSEDWCGIEEEDNSEVCQKKWDDYKSKFPKVTSKEQFDVES